MRRLALVLLCLLAPLALPAAATANELSRVQAAYAAKGSLAPCTFSTTQLQTALSEATISDFQYSSDLLDAIHTALAQRADGACDTHTDTTTTSTSPLATAGLAGGSPHLPGSVTGPGGAGLPLVLVALFVLGGLGLIIGAAVAAVRMLGLDSPLLRAAGHSIREAEYRLSAGWEDLADRFTR